MNESNFETSSEFVKSKESIITKEKGVLGVFTKLLEAVRTRLPGQEE